MRYINTNKKLFLSTACTGLILSATSTFPILSTNAITYGINDSNQTIDTSTIIGQTSDDNLLGIGLVDVTNITFDNTSDISANNNFGAGISIRTISTVKFNGNVTANENEEFGIFGKSNSTTTFNGNVMANQNSTGIHGEENSKIIFNGNVTTDNNADFGISISDNASMTFNKNVTVHRSINIDDNAKMIFNGNVESNILIFNVLAPGAGATVTLGDNITFDSIITNNSNGEGNLELLGSAKILRDIGQNNNPIGRVKFLANDANKVLSLGRNLNASSVIMEKATYRPTNNITITSQNITLKNPIFDLGKNNLKLSGNVSHNAAAGSLTFNTTYDGKDLGNIEQISKNFDMKTNVNSVKINLTEDPSLSFPKVGEIRQSDIFAINGGTYTLADDQNVVLDVTLNATNSPHSNLIEWSHSSGKLTNRIKSEFPDAVVINKALEATADGKGDIKFAGSISLNQPIGTPTVKLNNIEFTSPANGASASKLNKSIYAHNVEVNNKTSLEFESDVDIGLTAKNDSSISFQNIFRGKVNNASGNSKIIFNNSAILSAENEFIDNSIITFNKSVSQNQGNNSTLRAKNNSKVTFDDNVTASNFIVSDNASIIFKKSVNIDLLSFNNQSPTIIISEGATLNSPVISQEAGQGIIVVEGNTIINKSIGNGIIINQENFPTNQIQKITFSSNDPTKSFTVNGNILASEVFINQGKFTPANNILIATGNKATVHLNNPTFDLSENTLKFSGPVVHDDPNGVITINTTFNGDNAGHIEMTKVGDSIDLTNSKSTVINITDAPMTAQPIAGEVRMFDLFVENDGVLTLNKNNNTINAFTATNEANQFVEWSFDTTTGILSQKLVENNEEILQNVVNNPLQNKNLLNLNPQTTQELINIATNQGAASASEAIERLTNSDAVAIASAPVNLAIQDVTQIISNRAEKVSGSLQKLIAYNASSRNDYLSGVAAGDDIYKYGAWVSPTYGTNSQRSRGNQPGYKSFYHSVALGVDSLINDTTSLGLAISYIKTNIKHKDQNTGDKTKVNSFVLSGYGVYELSKEWFVQGIASIGRSKVKNREIRREFGATRIAAADYNLTSWGAEVLTGYNQKINNKIMITPLFGFEYNRLNGFSYQESGTNFQNLQIKGKAKNQLEAVAGARLSAIHDLEIKQHKITLLPEIHGNVRYGLLNQKLNLDIKQDGVNSPLLSPRTAKQVRAVYNLGVGVIATQSDKW